MDPVSFFAFLGTIIIVGFLGNTFFERTSVPDVLWLLLLGLLAGPILHLFDVSFFVSSIPLFAALALMVILFDSGLNTELIKLLKESPRAVTLTLVVFILSIAVTTVATTFLGWGLLKGMLLGAIVGGTSSPIVISILKQLRPREQVQMVLSIESILTDALCVIVAIALLRMLVAGQVSFSEAGRDLFGAFSMGGMVGIIAGIAWLYVLERIKGMQFAYMLTLAVLFFIYSGVEFIKGNGAIGALFFGLILGNGHEISRMFKLEQTLQVDELIKKFEAEITFFIRTFFFVYLGLVASLRDIWIIAFGVFLSLLLVAARFIGVQIATRRSDFSREEIFLMSIMTPRGLAAAVLASLPLSYGYSDAAVFQELVFTVIITTIVISTIGVYAMRKKRIPRAFLAYTTARKGASAASKN